MDLARYTALFLEESRTHLRTSTQLLLDWERDPTAREPVDGLFRAMHSLKGMAATMGFVRLAEAAHEVEGVLEEVRGGRLAPGADLVDALLAAVDALQEGVTLAAAGRDGELDAGAVRDRLARLQPRTARKAASRARKGAAPVAPAGHGRAVEVTIDPGTPMRGARALLALQRARALGDVRDLRPPLAALELDGFDGQLAFTFAGPASDVELEEALRGAGEVVAVAIGRADAAAQGEVSAGRARHIRVDLRRLDSLMAQVAELVVARNRLLEVAATQADAELDGVALRVARLASGIQHEVIEARLTPVWQVFDRFPRAVRDLARDLGKQVHFRVEGEEIELDRAILEEIGDPIMHLIRNALDHGIEPPDEREAAGKPAEGRLWLSASRERSNVVIRVGDDGRGIDRERVLERARQAGLLEGEAENLPDEQLLRVLARAGFTTAERVSGVSGRGVGVDAVVDRLRALGGSLELRSERGRGTEFTLRLPLTLAIVRALLARAGSERYALPLSYVAETVEYDQLPRTEVQGREAVVLRGATLPTLHLGRLVGQDGGATAPPAGRRPGVILEVGDRRAALVVDGLVGQQEIVVEAFDAPRGTPAFLSGATILPDGAPALILDPAVLV